MMTPASSRRLLRALMLRTITAGQKAGTAEGARVAREAGECLTFLQKEDADEDP